MWFTRLSGRRCRIGLRFIYIFDYRFEVLEPQCGNRCCSAVIKINPPVVIQRRRTQGKCELPGLHRRQRCNRSSLRDGSSERRTPGKSILVYSFLPSC